MADNTLQNGTDTIATDDLTTLNGGAVSGVKVQRVKVGFGSDSSQRDVDVNNGLPIQGSQPAAATTASWTSATTANTAISTSIAGYNTVSVAVVQGSTITAGVLTFEVSMDNTNWLPVALNRIDSFVAGTTYTLAASTNIGFTGSVDAFNYFRVRLSTAISGTGTVAIALQPQAFPVEPTVTVGQSTPNLLLTQVNQPTASNLNATVVVASGSNTIGSVNVTGRTSGGATSFFAVSAASTNATSVKTSVATLYSLNCYNNGASAAYVKIYNKASAPTVGTDTPVKVIMLPAGGGSNVVFPVQGIALSTGIAYAITGGAANSDATAVSANQVIVNGSYV